MDFIPESNGIYALKQLHVDIEKFASAITGWGDSFINMPEVIPFLCDETIDEIANYLEFDAQTIDEMKAAAATARQVFVLKAYIWHLYYRLVTPSFSGGCNPVSFGGHPAPDYHLKERSFMAYLLAGLGAMLKAREKYRADGLREEIIRDTLAIISKSANAFHFNHGRYGLDPQVFGWMRLYVTGRLIQLGRFNFKLMEFYPFGIVLKNRKDNRKLLLAQDGLQINSHGFCLQDKDPWSDKITNITLRETSEEYIGYVVNPTGFIIQEPHHFRKEEWEVILEPGDVMIDMHIPAGGGMTPELSRDSFAKAFEFFSKNYSGRFKPVICSHSWIFNTQFEDRMPNSNLAKLMRECYLFPCHSSGQDGVSFLFGRGIYSDGKIVAPRDTSVRRVMIEILESGERLRTAGMLYFAEDFDKFGTAFYRKQFRV